ncbi:hypothetical protein [Cypionkella sp.]|uniref:hypothetical protein n=1 Tax=Cypionkella sp. TaxID=2811411 RepID=UPI002ABAAE8B|nr:hypothetical protein [Cypionkella sp.]MDZ4392573.1 hypothetical protein [Cypionkella sp.]
MTVLHHADNHSSMNKSGLFVKVLVFAAYVLAMLVPGFTMVGEQTPVEHAQMMAMAGHEMNLADTVSSETDQTMLLCQQHCLVVVAALPAADQTIEIAGHPIDAVTGDDPLVSSLAFPPPGHPPKAVVI